MRDRDIRFALRVELNRRHNGDGETLILDELGVCEGACRADLAVINGHLGGFEIKSDRDTLARLPMQAQAYGRVFDYMTLVVGAKRLESINDHVPAWWSILLATESDGIVRLDPIRAGQRNDKTDAFAVAQFLWRSEALSLLERRGLDKGLRTKPRRALWSALAENLDSGELAREVRDQLRSREGWRSDPPPLPGDAIRPPVAR